MKGTSSIEIFADDSDGIEGIGLIVNDPSIVENKEGDLVAGCKMSFWDAKCLAHALQELVASQEDAA